MAIIYERDYNVRLIDMPPSVKGLIKEKEDYHTIVLNSRLTWEQNCKTFKHDYKHLENGDYEKDDVQQIETEAHRRR